MIETMLITFREGLEAFLIVAITLAYLHKTGRHNLAKGVYAGVAVALVLSATTGYHIAEMAETPIMEGSLAIIAGILVASLTYYVMKNAKTIKNDIANKIDHHAEKAGFAALSGIFLFTVLMISREGMETALMLGAISSNVDSMQLMIGASLGLLLTGAIGVLWVKKSNLINLRLFLQVTGIFLVLFSIHLFIYGLHELGEVNSLPFLNEEMQYAIHMYTEPFGHNSVYGQMVTYSLLFVPLLWLGFAAVKERFTEKKMQAAE